VGYASTAGNIWVGAVENFPLHLQLTRDYVPEGGVLVGEEFVDRLINGDHLLLATNPAVEPPMARSATNGLLLASEAFQAFQDLTSREDYFPEFTHRLEGGDNTWDG
jgi:hypothetical protein